MHSWWQQMREGGLDKGRIWKEHPFHLREICLMHADIKMEGLQSCSRDAHFLSWSVCCIEKGGGEGGGRGARHRITGWYRNHKRLLRRRQQCGCPVKRVHGHLFYIQTRELSLPPIRCFWWIVDPLQGGGEQRSTSLLGAHHLAADGCMSLQLFFLFF